MRDEALNWKFLVFKPFSLRPNILGDIENLARRDVRILETPTLTLTGHSNTIWSVLHLSHGRLASGSGDNMIRVWDLKEGRELFKLKGHTDSVYSLATLPNGLLVSGSLDCTIKIWDLEQRKEIRTLRGNKSLVLSFCVLKNGFLASCSSDNSIRVWNPYLSENNLLHTMIGHGISGWLISIDVLSNGSLVSCSREYDEKKRTVLRIWNVDEGKLIKEVATVLKAAYSLLAIRGDQVAIGSQEGEIRIVDLVNDAASVTKDQAHDSSIFALAQLSNGNLISCGQDYLQRTIKVWALPDFGLLQTINTGDLEDILSLSISHDETFLASAGEDNTIKLWAISN